MLTFLMMGLASIACGEIQLDSGRYSCTSDNECPEGWYCSEGLGGRCVDPNSADLALTTSPATQGGTCPVEGTAGLAKTGPEGVRVIRISLFEGTAEYPSSSSFICDRLVAADESGHAFFYQGPEDPSVPIYVVAEAFAEPASQGDPYRLLASGSGFVQDGRIFMPYSGRLGCAQNSMNKARAFHSVTALPRGHALIVGGLVATNGEETVVAEGSGLFLTDEVEIYDARLNRFRSVAVEGDAGIARAFHSAFLMPGSTSTEARVLVVGGVGQGWASEGEGVVKIRTGPQHPFRLTPDPAAGTPHTEILTVDLTTSPPTVTRHVFVDDEWPGRFFQGATSNGQGGATLAGGASAVDETGSLTILDSIDLGFPDSGEHHPQSGQLLVPRVGLTLTRLTPIGESLAWGGNLDQVDSVGTLAEFVSISPAPPSSVALLFDSTGSNVSNPHATAFHTSTLLAGGDVLVVGGFQIEGSFALNPPNSNLISRVHMQGSDFQVFAQDETDFVPVGYHAALALPDGQVLITGGSPTFEPGNIPCPSGANAWTCSSSQALLFTPGAASSDAGSLNPLAYGGMQVPRFGHTMTLLDGGLVLVVGGLRRDGSTLYTEASAEFFNPSDGSAAVDVLGREPNEIYSVESECPVFNTSVPSGYRKLTVRF